jgi:hypothetical protein
MATVARDPLERYLEKVDERAADECWLWKAALFGNGYGAFRLGDRQVRAHRFGYEVFVGPIPDGLIVCHRCDVPACQNPAHWFLGTNRDNAIDRERKGRGRYRHIGPLPPKPRVGRRRGEQHHKAKLTEADVRAIRAACGEGQSQDAVAVRFGVSQRLVSGIVRRQIWRHIS